MKRLFKAQKLLTKQTLDEMHQAALTMLAKTGMEVKHSEISELISKRPGFTAKNGRILISAAKVEAFVKSLSPAGTGDKIEVPYSISQFDYTCAVSDRSAFIVERDGRTIRPMKKDDVITGCKLVGVLAKEKGLRGATIGIPTDAPIPLQAVEQFMITAQYSPAGGFTSQVCDIPSAEIIMEMEQVYGRPFYHDVWSPSPLQLSGSGLDVVWHFRDKVKFCRIGSMPIMGLTGPCDPIACFTLSVAECLGAGAILHELLPELAVSMIPHPEPADMQTGSIVFGSPEWELLDLMHEEVFSYYGIHWLKSLHTTAPIPDAQAIMERTASAMNGMLSGHTHFGPIGQLSLDEVYSPAMLMLDLEILEHAYRIAGGASSGDGLELSGLTGVVDSLVRERISFAEHETTVANLRTQYYQPKLMSRTSKGQWEQMGKPDIIANAYAMADEVTARYDYEAPTEILKELRAIYSKGKEKLK